MEEMIYIENEVLLSRIEAELTELNIKYVVKRTDVISYPSNVNKMYCAILFSNSENRNLIIEVYENIKSDYFQESSEKNNTGSHKVLKNIFLLFIFVLLIFIIIIQRKVYNDLKNALDRPETMYKYSYSRDWTELEIHCKRENRLIERHIDRNLNGISEIIEIYLPNGNLVVYFDDNENGYSEKVRTYKDDILIEEGFSTRDNGVYDIWNYYKNGVISQTCIYNEETNEIRIE